MFKKIVIFGAICFLLSLGTAWGTVRHVPSVYPTIQNAIDASVNGDEVLVARGTYLESLSIVGKYLTLRSVEGPSLTTIWGGGNPDPVVDVYSGWGNPATVIEGFEITSRYGPYYYHHYSSGIACSECSLKVVNCDINRCYYHGIESYEAFVELVNTLVVDNKGIANSLGTGIYGNTADFHIQNCTIANNNNKNGGAGIYLSDAIYFTKIYNSVIWGNVSDSTPSGDQIWLSNMAFLVIEYCDLQGGSAEVEVELNCTLSWGGGMIDMDPLFVDPSGNDYHLTYPSPCKDTGDSSFVNVLHDFEGDPRIAYGLVDMGADEFYPHLYYKGEATPSGNIDLKFVGIPGDLVNGLILGINIFDPPLPCDYGLWYMDNPIQIVTGFGLIPADGVMVFPGTIPLTPAAPYTVYLQAAIDSWLTNLCVLEVV